jgi:hypothetical protein
LFNPFGCAVNGFWSWYHGLDPIWFLVAGLIIGMAYGAKYGWWGIAALLTAGIAVLWLRQSRPIDPVENVEGHDADPPHSFNDLIKPRPAKPNTRKLTDEELKRIMYGSGK